MLELQRPYLQWGFNSMALPQKEYNSEDLIYGVKGLFTRLKWRLITFVIKSSQKWRLCYSENGHRPLIVIRRSSSNEKSWTISWVSRHRLHIHGLRFVIRHTVCILCLKTINGFLQPLFIAVFRKLRGLKKKLPLG